MSQIWPAKIEFETQVCKFEVCFVAKSIWIEMPGKYNEQQAGAVDLWALAEEDVELNLKSSELAEDSSTVLIVGDPGSGKSSLMQGFLKPNNNKDPKTTFALEYSFARRKNAGGSGGKTLAHIWELGGDIREPKLLEIPLALESLASTSVIITIDLSKPEDCFVSLERWIQLIRSHLTQRFNEFKAGDNKLQSKAKAMKDATQNMYMSKAVIKGEGPDEKDLEEVVQHVDFSRVRISEVPILIVANKFDVFRSKQSASDRRTLIQTLRFLAHYHGASLVVTSCKDSAGGNKDAFRACMNNLCFGVSMRPMCEVGSERPSIVTAGSDDFSSILRGKGTGKSAEEDGKSQFASSDSDVDSYLTSTGVKDEAWSRFRSSLESYFGGPGSAAGAGVKASSAGAGDKDGQGGNQGEDENTGANNNEHPETDVDDARGQRDMILDQYVADAARRANLAARSRIDEDMTSRKTSSSTRSEGKEDSEMDSSRRNRK